MKTKTEDDSEDLMKYINNKYLNFKEKAIKNLWDQDLTEMSRLPIIKQRLN
jgi:hypothetical protein